jgi:rod shape determining protein RodA
VIEENPLENSYEKRLKKQLITLRWKKIHIDPLLLSLLLLLSTVGLFVLYSASNQNNHIIQLQLFHIIAGLLTMLIVAQAPPGLLQRLSPWLYAGGILLLLLVLLVGHTSQGAKRWIQLGSIQLQPSEIMKLATPMMLAWFLAKQKGQPSSKNSIIAMILLLAPTLLIAKQPDLGTAIIIAISGGFALLLAGINRRLLLFLAIALLIATPILWHFMHNYQKMRILVMLDPQRDPLGAGYNIIQSKIAVGSGGMLGKGWLQGTQSHLSFLPTHTTDFIFAVAAEEFGFIGCAVIILVLSLITMRGLFISINAQSSYTRILSGSICFTFISNAIINIAMVIGLAPVVGVPLSLISYGGTSIITTFTSFAILMSIHTNRKLWNS